MKHNSSIAESHKEFDDWDLAAHNASNIENEK